MKWMRVTVPVLMLGACAPSSQPAAGPVPDAGLPHSAWVDETLNHLDLQRKVAQLVFPRIDGAYMADGSGSYERMRYWVRDLGVGGVVITIGPPLEMAVKLNTMQDMADIPVFTTADMESGPGQVLQGGTVLPYGLETGSATKFPPVMALGATGEERFAYAVGRITALEGRAAGVHWDFAPVVDVNNNPNNPIINTRSYGADPTLVSRMATAHIRGLQDNGMLATAKHFPGHGDTQTDSHISLPVIAVDRARADTVELPPYRAAFAADVAAIMSAHISFPAITGDSIPSTLNPKLLTGLLRRDLGFKGLVFTDAMDMGAITSGWGALRAPILALQAGADVLLQPNPGEVKPIIDAIVEAIRKGELSEARIDASVRRVLAAKERLGLNQNRHVDINRISSVLGAPAHFALADTIAQRSITAVRDRDHLLPVKGKVLSIVYSDDYDPWTGRTFQREIETLIPGAQTVTLSDQATPSELERLARMAQNADVVLFSPFIRVRAAKGGVAMPERVGNWLNELMKTKPVVLTSFGNPYVLQQLPELSTYVVAWGQIDASQRAAARALAGRAPITGKLPIPIPPLHRTGEGLQLGVRVDQ